MQSPFTLQANLTDLHQRRIFHAEIRVENGRIQSIRPLPGTGKNYLLPGFIDAHVHIESSMLTPAEFGRMAVVHGTVGTVSDPHEIANVLGEEGVLYMLENAAFTPLKCCFGAPSCVPATTFETAGAQLGPEAVERLLRRPDIFYLSEMMNFPGVLFEDEAVMAKLAAAHRVGKPVDGHAPALRGEDAKKYFGAGITTDHECFTYEEGLEKACLGVKILIREGSAARNFEALIGLLPQFPEQIMFCSDDKHPDDLVRGHINQLAARAVAKGCNLFDVLRAACLNPVEHYKMPVGLLREGDPADFILVEDLENFRVLKTWIDGDLVAENGKTLLEHRSAGLPNQFNTPAKSPEDFRIVKAGDTVRVIRALDGEIVTENETTVFPVNGMSDVDADVLKIAVVNRYSNAPPALGYIRGFGLKTGAIASCVAHDSHNIVAVGVSDDLLCRAVNAVIRNKGGISAVDEREASTLALPVAGIMSPGDGYEVARLYAEVDAFAKTRLGCLLKAPFMTLSFMALPVIPKLKMTDKGLFDVEKFGFSEVFI